MRLDLDLGIRGAAWRQAFRTDPTCCKELIQSSSSGGFMVEETSPKFVLSYQE